MGAGERPDVTTRVRSAGLCATCRHAEIITSTRGSVFYLCRLSASDPRYPKYPPLPVLMCEGYDAGERDATDVI